jgi:hypothetical protein
VKLVHITYRFEFTAAVESILDRNGIADFVRSPMIDSRDRDGKHFGSKIFPGNGAVVQAIVDDERVGPLLEELNGFREQKDSHLHLRVLVLAVDRVI